jgi:hypothetical protein
MDFIIRSGRPIACLTTEQKRNCNPLQGHLGRWRPGLHSLAGVIPSYENQLCIIGPATLCLGRLLEIVDSDNNQLSKNG